MLSNVSVMKMKQILEQRMRSNAESRSKHIVRKDVPPQESAIPP